MHKDVNVRCHNNESITMLLDSVLSPAEKTQLLCYAMKAGYVCRQFICLSVWCPCFLNVITWKEMNKLNIKEFSIQPIK